MEEKRMSERSTRHGVLGRLSVILGICACLAGCRLVVNASDPTPSPDPAATPAATATPEAATTPSPSPDPQADAGQDLRGVLGGLVRLSGSVSGFPAEGSAYAWSFVGLPHDSKLGPGSISGADSLNASFLPDADGIYQLDFTASIPGLSVTDRVVVSVDYDLNRAPNAQIGFYPMNYCQPGEDIEFSPYAWDDDMDGLSYVLSVESEPAGSSLSIEPDAKVYCGENLPVRTLRPQVEGRYEIRLTVTDAKGAQGTALAGFTVKAKNPHGNTSPIANAGGDMILSQAVNATVGTNISSADLDGDPLSYSWECVSYPACFPAQAAAALAQNGSGFSLSMGLPTGVYVFELTVDDGTVQGPDDQAPTDTDTMTVTMLDTPLQIWYAKTQSQSVAVGATASAAFQVLADPDITYNLPGSVGYSFVSKPAASTCALVPSYSVRGSVATFGWSFAPDSVGTYVVAATFIDHARTFTRIMSVSAATDEEGVIDVSVY
jgi:hypothetical protein